MKWFLSSEGLQYDFIQEVEERSGTRVSTCYQCGKCSAGCPTAYVMDYTPNQVIRMVQLGMREVVMSSTSFWLCLSCETCTTRCPREIDIAEIMDALRRMAYAEKYLTPEKDIPLFNEIFLEEIRRYGRLYETGLIGNYNLNSGHYFKDMILAPVMFLKRKIKLLPYRTKNVKEVQEIFRKESEIGGI